MMYARVISDLRTKEDWTLPSGDGNRIWFPEMIEMLRSQWNESTTFPRLVELCAMLDGALQYPIALLLGLVCLPVLAARSAAESSKPKVLAHTASAFGPPSSRLGGSELLRRN